MSYVVAVPDAPAEDAALDAVLQAMVVGITGLDGSLVRPRWQPTLPQQPEPTVNWCAIGVLSATPDFSPWITHVSGPNVTDPSADLSVRYETLDVLATFYGPNAKSYAGVLRDGLGIPQNNEPLNAADIYLIETMPQRRAPELVNQQWINRWDLMIRFTRQIQRVYAVPNIVLANIHIQNDSDSLTETVYVPPL